MWLPKLETGNQPTYLALVEAISAAIRSGELASGARLPPQRRLAWALGINPSTVAARRHLVSGEVGRGTYVLADSREASLFLLKQPLADSSSIDLSTNVPVTEADNRDLSRTLASLAERGELDTLQSYAPATLVMRGRIAASQWLQG
uniref:GntR family transcriptional regulator n=1 Tax=Pseudomonas sp. TaxID=306 RepID=UPI0028ACCF49